MKNSDFSLLLFIANYAGLQGTLFLSTAAIAKKQGISQQSVSRKLRALEDAGMISRSALASGTQVSLSQAGRELLKKQHMILQSIFSTKKAAVSSLVGVVQTGLGEGKYYVGFSQYATQFEKLFGFFPFPGTLNLAVSEPAVMRFLAGKKPYFIKGFATKERSFGGLTAYPVKIRSIPAALIVPDRTAYKNKIIEIVAAPFLRGVLHIKDGDRVKVMAGDKK